MPHNAIPIARIVYIPILTTKGIQREAEAILFVLASDLRLDLARTVVILIRPKAANSEVARAPAATEAAFRRLERVTLACLEERPIVVGRVAVCVSAVDVIDVEGVEPGSGCAFFDREGYVRCVVGGEGEGYCCQDKGNQG